jgi:hypothetical protein
MDVRIVLLQPWKRAKAGCNRKVFFRTINPNLRMCGIEPLHDPLNCVRCARSNPNVAVHPADSRVVVFPSVSSAKKLWWVGVGVA